MKYRMIALDLDGTLLDGGGVASASNLDAIARARAAGALVVPCTGRGWRESCGALRELTNGLAIPVPAGQKPEIAGAPGVFACGSSVNDLGTGKALHTMGIAADLALELVRFLADMPDSVLVFGDLERAGYNYLVTGSGVLSPNTQWWFEATEVTVRYQKMVELTDLGHTLRVGMVGSAVRIVAAAQRVRAAFKARVNVQSFEAVQMPDPSENVHVLEVFAAGVDKWRGLAWLAERRGIATAEVAAIGDQVNDIAMIQAAGCGIAMGNAIHAGKAAAHHVTLDHNQHGVAFAIEQLLAERW